MSPQINPQVAHQIDARILLAHLPHVDQTGLREIRMQFAQFLSSFRTRTQEYGSWQDAWNDFTGATEHRPGQIRYYTRCPSCHGRGFSHRNISRNISRTGSPYACGECRGVPGRRISVTQSARFIAPPVPETDSAPTDSTSTSSTGAE